MKKQKLVILIIVMLLISNKLYAQNLSQPIVILSSYSISGNMLNDKVITLHLVLTNTNQKRDAQDILVSFTGLNNIFLPAYGSSNQFFIPSIPAGASVEKDLSISVNDPIPNDILYFDFIAIFFDPETGINTNKFFISENVKNANVIQLLGMEPVGINVLDDGSRIITFKATIINQGNFIVKNATMILTGKTNDFNISIPLSEITPGDFLVNEFNLTLQPDYLPDFIVKLNYIDINGANYESDIQQISVYLNNLLAENNLSSGDEQYKILFRTVGLVLTFLFFLVGAIILFFKLRKKKGF